MMVRWVSLNLYAFIITSTRIQLQNRISNDIFFYYFEFDWTDGRMDGCMVVSELEDCICTPHTYIQYVHTYIPTVHTLHRSHT